MKKRDLKRELDLANAEIDCKVAIIDAQAATLDWIRGTAERWVKTRKGASHHDGVALLWMLDHRG